MMSAETLVLAVAALATLGTVASALYVKFKEQPSAKVTLQYNGKVEAFDLSLEDAARLKTIVEQFQKKFRDQGHPTPS